MYYDGVNFLPADIICCHAHHFLASAIRWFTRSRNEAPSYTHHIAGISTTGNCVLEELSRLTEMELETWMVLNPAYEVWRYTPIDISARILIARDVECHVGRRYAWWKISTHAMDGLMGKAVGRDVFCFRRLLFTEDRNICSGRWACAYSDYKGYDGLHNIPPSWPADPHCLDPDSMHDYFRSSPDWSMVYRKGDPPAN